MNPVHTSVVIVKLKTMKNSLAEIKYKIET